MKKLFAFISVFLMLSVTVFADVSAKKLSDGSIEVTFFYGNPRATEVLLAGDFTNWQDGALPMTKGEKGFSITKTFKASDEIRYKFISDGNWTTDLKAPDFVDDGFGGKNGHAVIGELVSGGDDSGVAKAKINFVSWTMFGIQGKYRTQAVSDPSKKGLDLKDVTVGFKSYDKFVGTFIPNAPVYVEIALAEKDIEDYQGNTKPIYLYQRNDFGVDVISFEEGIKNFISGIFSNPVAYLSETGDNSDSAKGPGKNPFLGHLKFGWNTPYINYVTGFNYAKPDVRQKITWKTIDGNWDAGYEHVGGFNQFSMGDKAVAALAELTGMSFDVGFAPNKTADRRGSKYGYWAWAGFSLNDLVVDFQSNGMYNGDYMFYKPVEHDFIIGAKNTFDFGDAGKLSASLQGLIATHQMSSAEIVSAGASNTTDYFGYSTDVFYRSGDFDGIKNIAGNVQIGYECDMFSTNLEYRLRGAQASMLYLRQNHDDGTFDLSETLGVLNSQKITLTSGVKIVENVNVGLEVSAELPLEKLDATDKLVSTYATSSTEGMQSWYAARFLDDVKPLFDVEGVELAFMPSVEVGITDSISVSGYADMKFQTMESISTGTKEEYEQSDSKFLFEVAGLKGAFKFDNDIVKGLNVFYGFDNSNKERLFNTLCGQVMFPADLTATLTLGLKTVKDTNAGKAFNKDANNPFAFGLGVSKKFASFKKPTVYAEFVYNMDPYKKFGDGQDQLNLDRSNFNGGWQKEGAGGIDPVDYYDGEGALRVGIRWDI